jgi:hypothetical protein
MNLRALLLLLAVVLVTVSCSSGPTPPQPGSPAFYWNAARQAYAAGDFPRTSNNLSEILSTDNEYAARARVWQVVMSAGVAQGLSELANGYEAGAKANRANPMPFRRQTTDLRTTAGRSAVDLAETVHGMLAKEQPPEIAFAFDFPSGSATEPGNIKKIYAGMLMQESEAQTLQKEMMQRGVLLALCAVAGTPGDSAKLGETFKAGEVKVPRATFLYGTAKVLYDTSEIFGANKLDQPQRLSALCNEALECLKGVPESKDTKDLATKIQAALKKIRKSGSGA